jgi:hypothetical protein
MFGCGGSCLHEKISAFAADLKRSPCFWKQGFLLDLKCQQYTICNQSLHCDTNSLPMMHLEYCAPDTQRPRTAIGMAFPRSQRFKVLCSGGPGPGTYTLPSRPDGPSWTIGPAGRCAAELKNARPSLPRRRRALQPMHIICARVYRIYPEIMFYIPL